MTDKWMIKGAEFVNCNCDFGCPCQFNAPSTHGFCEALGSFSIDEGYFNDTPLDGLKFVTIMKWPGEIAEGNGEAQVIIDESATPEQRDALLKIVTGESTTPGATIFNIFAATFSTLHDPLFLPIDMDIDVDSRRGHTRIEGTVDTRGAPLINPFSGEEARAGIHLPDGFEYTYAEMGVGSTVAKSEAVELTLSDTYGQFARIHWNQDGVIRDEAA